MDWLMECFDSIRLVIVGCDWHDAAEKGSEGARERGSEGGSQGASARARERERCRRVDGQTCSSH